MIYFRPFLILLIFRLWFWYKLFREDIFKSICQKHLLASNNTPPTSIGCQFRNFAVFYQKRCKTFSISHPQQLFKIILKLFLLLFHISQRAFKTHAIYKIYWCLGSKTCSIWKSSIYFISCVDQNSSEYSLRCLGISWV